MAKKKWGIRRFFRSRKGKKDDALGGSVRSEPHSAPTGKPDARKRSLLEEAEDDKLHVSWPKTLENRMSSAPTTSRQPISSPGRRQITWEELEATLYARLPPRSHSAPPLKADKYHVDHAENVNDTTFSTSEEDLQNDRSLLDDSDDDTVSALDDESVGSLELVAQNLGCVGDYLDDDDTFIESRITFHHSQDSIAFFVPGLC